MEKRKLNQTMELCKMIAAIFIVFLHYPFLGTFGKAVNCLSRFAVPVFFAISGYFSYGVDSNRFVKRIKHILKLNIISTLVYVLWSVIAVQRAGNVSVTEMLEMKLSAANIVKWLFINVNPFAGHLWYLAAILTCYVILWAYAGFYEGKQINYTPLYILGFTLILLHLLFSTVATASKMSVPYFVYRNALLFGLPMVVLGIFVREYGERIVNNFKLNGVKTIILITVGSALSLLQWKGLGKIEMPVGALITVVALMLFMSTQSEIPFVGKHLYGLFSHFGNISLIMYICHILIGNVIKTYSADSAFLMKIAENGNLFPCAILIFSILAGVIFDIFSTLIKNVKKKQKN